MSRITPVIAPIFFLASVSTNSLGQDSRWGAPGDSTVKFIIDSEAKWARSDCGRQPDLGTFIADDFQGTGTDGRRTSKAEAIASGPAPEAHGCTLGDVKVRFFGDSIAIAYGSESRIPKAAKGAEARRCQVWTDTWLKRNGTWKIIAAQDTIVPCKSQPPTG